VTLRTSLSWSFTEEIGKKVLHLGGSIVIARLLTPDEMGVFALAVAVHALIGAIKQFGISQYLIREPALDDDKIRSAFGVWLIVACGLATILLATRGVIADLYDTPGIAAVLAVIALSFFATPFGEPARALLQREMRFDLINHVMLTSAAIKLAATVGFALLGWSYMALAWGMLLGNLVQSALFLALRPRHLRMRPSLHHWRSICDFGGWVTGASIAGNITVEGQKFILGGFINPGAVALFDRAVQVPSMFRMSLLQPVGRVMFPALSQDIREGRRIGAKIETFVAAYTVLVWPAFLTVAFVAEPLIVFVFGENWRVAGQILPWLLLSHAILAALPQPETILVPHGRVKRVFAVRAFSVVNALSFAVAGASHSLEMFAHLRPVATSLFLIVLVVAMFRLMDVTPARLFKQYARAAATAAVSAVPAVIAAGRQGADMDFAHLAFALGAAPPIWLIALFALRHPLAGEVSRVLVVVAERLGLPRRLPRAPQD